MDNAIIDRYPRTSTLEDSARVTFSLMSSADREPLSKFISRLQRTDLSYLQVDITKPDVQERWFDSIAAGKSICLCAYDPAGLIGYASIQLSDSAVKRTGEIRVNIAQGYRSRGLGRALLKEIFFIATEIRLDVVTARMLSDQHGARAAFRHLGFEEEKVLKGYVKSASGNARDLLVMAAELRH